MMTRHGSRTHEYNASNDRPESEDANQLLSEVLSIASDAIIIIDASHHITTFNSGAEQIFGFTAEEIIGHPIESLIPDQFRENHSNLVDEYGRSQDGSSRMMGERAEIVGLKKDRTEFPAEASISTLQTTNGTVFTVILRDITERKIKEATRNESRDKFQNLIKGFQFGFIVHKNGELVYINEAAAGMHGYDVQEATGRNITDFIAPQEIPKILKRAEARLQGDAAPDLYEYLAIRKDGSTFPIQISPQTIDWNGEPAILSALYDVSEHKRAEASESRLGRIIEQSLNEIYVFDATTLKFSQTNYGARSNLGYSTEELRDMSPVCIKPEYTRESFESAIQPLKDGSIDKLVFETIHERNDGSTYDVEVHLQYMVNEQPPVFFAIIKDITIQKQVERDLNLAVAKSNEASRAKSEFLSNMSHEIRTPMNGVLGIAEILLSMDLAPKQKVLAQHLSDSGHTLLALLNDILDLAKIEAGKISVESIDFSLQKLLDPVTTLWEAPLEKKDLEFDVTVASDVSPVLLSDPGRIGQILHNLIGNAAKFTEKGGVRLGVTQTLVEDGQLELHFAVTDTGAGIEIEDQEMLFGKFTQADSTTTRKHGGTGLGLAISKQLVELLGGTMGVESTPGEGSTFWFTIRCQPGDPEAAPEEVDLPAFSTGKSLTVQAGGLLREKSPRY